MAKKSRTGETRLEKERKRLDSGFGSAVTSKEVRLMQENGDFNVRRRGQSLGVRLNTYHRLITIGAIPFICIVSATYFAVNLFFASLYYLIGVENLAGAEAQSSSMHPFWSAFFFSSQTLTTVGYGHISPVGWLSSSVAAIEALLGLMMFAIITGLLYGRFSRPDPRIRFSKHLVFAPYLDMNGAMFRLVNERSNQIIDVSANVSMSRNEENEQGAIARKYYNLPLERNAIKFFATSWTVVHPITEESPFYGQTPESIAKSDTEIIIAIQGTNDTNADPVLIRKSYRHNEFLWGKKFAPIISNNDRHYIIDIDKIDDMVDKPLNKENPE